jgi:hypothetical protein
LEGLQRVQSIVNYEVASVVVLEADEVWVVAVYFYLEGFPSQGIQTQLLDKIKVVVSITTP